VARKAYIPGTLMPGTAPESTTKRQEQRVPIITGTISAVRTSLPQEPHVDLFEAFEIISSYLKIDFRISEGVISVGRIEYRLLDARTQHAKCQLPCLKNHQATERL
jgi:hypothetical protein